MRVSFQKKFRGSREEVDSRLKQFQFIEVPRDINSAKSTARRKLKRNLDLRRFRAPSTQSQNTDASFCLPFLHFPRPRRCPRMRPSESSTSSPLSRNKKKNAIQRNIRKSVLHQSNFFHSSLIFHWMKIYYFDRILPSILFFSLLFSSFELTDSRR